MHKHSMLEVCKFGGPSIQDLKSCKRAYHTKLYTIKLELCGTLYHSQHDLPESELILLFYRGELHHMMSLVLA